MLLLPYNEITSSYSKMRFPGSCSCNITAVLALLTWSWIKLHLGYSHLLLNQKKKVKETGGETLECSSLPISRILESGIPQSLNLVLLTKLSNLSELCLALKMVL